MKAKAEEALNSFLRVRAYIRYSTVNQDDGFSIEYQVSEIDQYLKKHGMVLEKTHIDQAQTATKVAGRDEFFALIEDVKKGLVDAIIVYKMNRLFRNSLESHKYRKLFRDHKVKIISVTQHIDEETSEGRFMTSTLANVDQYLAESTSDHVISSMREMARQGYYTGGRVLYGYKLETFDHGGRERKKYTPNEEQAKNVNLLFKMFADGYSVVQIMKHFMNENILNNYGKHFNEQNLRNMLKNDCYIGTMRYGVKDYDEIVTVNAHQPIISRELWQAVQYQFEKGKKVKPRKKKYLYALTGKVYCGCCGTHFFGCSSSAVRGDKRYVYHSYVCRQKRNFRNCDNPQITKENLESIVLSSIKINILNETMINDISEKVVDMYKKSPTSISEKINMLSAREKDIKKELNTLIDMRLNGEMSGDIIKERSAPLEKEKYEIEKLLFSLREQQKYIITPDQVKEFLFDMLYKAENCNEEILKSIFDCFVEKVVITLDKIDIKLRVFPAPEFAYKEIIATPIFDLYAHTER